ncbi:hypothetical protein AK830_g12490 [Neonectria ditissima]|uniref:Uncharacterized protein n=1 Tax=Neonectria ditissima TaxID=78410 RepID=A0A0N8H4R2_9HYPO|nr:hypothetical protein AK830_g12490 [Neonectria ditissima]
MSIVPARGILRKLYNDAAENIEYKSASFWHGWLQRAFNDQDVYHISPEFSPDGSLRRVDAVVQRYDDAHDTLSAMLWVEFKRPSGSVSQVEGQALDAAIRCITKDNLQFVYVMTTVGVSFRAWTVTKRGRVLQPFHGGPADATRAQYVDADSNDARVLERFANRVQTYPPLRIAPVVPSQPLPQGEYGQSGYGQGSYGGYAELQQQYSAIGEQGGYASEVYGGSSASEMVYQGQDMATTTQGQASAAGDDQWIKVHVTRVSHLTRATEYTFSDINGNTKSTTKDDWRRVSHNGKAAWIIQRRSVVYYTRERIG